MFAMQTGDPQFDPRKPIEINGYLFLPADGSVDKVSVKPGRSPRTVVEVKRRRVTER